MSLWIECGYVRPGVGKKLEIQIDSGYCRSVNVPALRKSSQNCLGLYNTNLDALAKRILYHTRDKRALKSTSATDWKRGVRQSSYLVTWNQDEKTQVE